MKGLASVEKTRDMIRYFRPVTFVGMDKDRKACVLIATIYKSDDRRMNLWTVTAPVTRNVVTVCTNANRDILGPYGAR